MEIVTLLLDRKSNVNAVSERCPGCPQSPQSRFLRQWPRSLPLPPPPHSPASNGDPSPTSDKEAADVITISALDMLVKAAALAMKQVPDWNASWMDTFILGGYQPYNEHQSACCVMRARIRDKQTAWDAIDHSCGVGCVCSAYRVAQRARSKSCLTHGKQSIDRCCHSWSTDRCRSLSGPILCITRCWSESIRFHHAPRHLGWSECQSVGFQLTAILHWCCAVPLVRRTAFNACWMLKLMWMCWRGTARQLRHIWRNSGVTWTTFDGPSIWLASPPPWWRKLTKGNISSRSWN